MQSLSKLLSSIWLSLQSKTQDPLEEKIQEVLSRNRVSRVQYCLVLTGPLLSMFLAL